MITLNVTATPEVAGNAAMPLNLGNLDDLIKKIRMFLGSEDLGKKYIMRGYENIKRCLWGKSARIAISAISGLRQTI